MIPAKKAAKKSAKHVNPEDPGPKDMRRAYEHLGRVEILHHSLDKGKSKDITTLTSLAQKELAAGHMKDAADLLRCAEHLSFALLGSSKGKDGVDPKLEEAISKEFGHILSKAEEHWAKKEDRLEHTEELYGSISKEAQAEFDRGSYRKALELARAAEALAHVKKHGAPALASGSEQKKLSA